MKFKAEVAVGEARRPAERARLRIDGLCRDCVAEETCTFPRDPSRPVWSCDEFEGAGAIPAGYTVPVGKAPPLSIGVEEMARTTELKGLCRECANRQTCQYPKPPGGVWHCEELA